MSSRSPIPVVAFVDWYNMLVEVDEDERLGIPDRTSLALRALARRIDRILGEIDGDRFRVRIRVYGGWTKGTTRSEFFTSILASPEYRDLPGIFRKANINVEADLEFGDRLLVAMENRTLAPHGIHLPNTLRSQSGRRRRVEKMVDTALASDAVQWASTNPQAWTIIISDDDDMVPPALTVEAIHAAMGGRAMLARSSTRGESRFLRLEGLLCA